jgi:S-adenosylmethionine hydrolase
MHPPLLTLLTDFGTRDYYAAALKGIVLRLAPGATLVDLSHEVEPGDVEGAAFLLAAAAPAFPVHAVHLAVVDPGVGSARRMLCLSAESGTYLAPDNGLLSPVFGLAGAAMRSVERPDLYLPSGGETFHGRDRFAPVAAALLRGEPAARLGPVIDDPVRLSSPPPVRSALELRGRVAHIDRYGNLVTDIPSAWLGNAACEVWVTTHSTRRLVTHYAALAPREPGVLAGSLATLELALRGDSLALRWGVSRGAGVLVRLL